MTLAQWLESLGCYDVKPCKVTIGRDTYEGAFYREDRDPLPGARSQERYTIESFYLLAESLPSCYRRSSRVAFTLEGDAREWYIGGHSACLMAGKSKFAQHHRAQWQEVQSAKPFGKFLLLGPWNVPDGTRIDQYEDRPYRRVPMMVEWLGEETNDSICSQCRCVPCYCDEQPIGFDHASCDVDSLPTLTREEG